MKRASRQSSKLPESLHRQFNSYAIAASAAGVSLLALAQPAEARIVYKEVNIKIVPHGDALLFFHHAEYPQFAVEGTTFSGNGSAWSSIGVAGINGTGNSIIEEFHGGHDLGAAALKVGSQWEQTITSARSR